MNGAKSSSQSILMEEKNLIFHVLNIAITTNQKVLFNNFYKKLNQISEEHNLELELLNRLMNNQIITDDFINESINKINSENLELFLNVISNYKDINIQCRLLNQTSKRFPGSTAALNQYGLALTKLQKFEEAQKVFSSSYSINSKEPSIIFYLISANLQTNNLSVIPSLIIDAEKNFNRYAAGNPKNKPAKAQARYSIARL